jgi:glycosyltransferase involved in cell wall biosynthesis
MDPILGEYLRPFGGMPLVMDVAAEYALHVERMMVVLPPEVRPLWALRALKWRAYNRRLAKIVDLWIMAGPADRQAIIRQCSPTPRAVVVPNGVDLAANPYAFKPDTQPNVVFCSALSYAPNVDALRYLCREIWPRVTRANPEARLLVTGDSSCAPPEVHRTPGVTLTGYLPSVYPVLASSRATVAPLRVGVGTRLKILEALAVGTPVVSTTIGAEGLHVRDGEHLLLADEPRLFAERLIELLESPELRTRLSAAGRALVEASYAWSRIGASFRAHLEELTAGSTPYAPVLASPAAADGGITEWESERNR